MAAQQALAAQEKVKRSFTGRLRIYDPFIKPMFDNKGRSYHYLADIIKTLPPDHKLNISVGSERTCLLSYHCGSEDGLYFRATDFNHAKYIIVDNKRLLTGGHNLWKDYLEATPPNDLSIYIEGDVADGATQYANAMWHKLKQNVHIYNYLANFCYSYRYTQRRFTEDCMVNLPIPKVKTISRGKDKVLYVSKLDNVIKDGDQSEQARVYAFSKAQKSIKISQQALYYIALHSIIPPVPVKHGQNSITAMAKAMLRGVNVYIVTSGAKALHDYSSYVSGSYIRNQFKKELSQLKLDNKTVNTILAKHFHFKEFSNSKNDINDIYPSHNKFWMVDDHIYYIGSHNLYADSEQQFGIITSSNSQEIIKTLWYPLWENAHSIQPSVGSEVNG